MLRVLALAALMLLAAPARAQPSFRSVFVEALAPRLEGGWSGEGTLAAHLGYLAGELSVVGYLYGADLGYRFDRPGLDLRVSGAFLLYGIGLELGYVANLGEEPTVGPLAGLSVVYARRGRPQLVRFFLGGSFFPGQDRPAQLALAVGMAFDL